MMRVRFCSWGKGSRIDHGAKLVSPNLVRVGNNVIIRDNIWINAKDDRGDKMPTLSIGNGTYIGRFVQINAWRQVEIEDNVLISDRVFISDADHNYDNPKIPILHQGDSFTGGVTLKEGCWLGIGVVVMPGVTIGRNAVVAANAVVTKSVPDFAVVGGIPAKKLNVSKQKSI